MASPEHTANDAASHATSRAANNLASDTHTANLLPNLRDIHLPTPVSSWPPSAFVWLLLTSALVLLALFGWMAWQHTRKRKPAMLALRELDTTFALWKESGSTAAYLEHSGVILKKLSLRIADPHTSARLTGGAWVEWISSRVEQPQKMSAEIHAALVHQRYQRKPNVDISSLHQALTHWIKHCERGTRA